MPDQYGLVYNLNEPFWLAPWLGLRWLVPRRHEAYAEQSGDGRYPAVHNDLKFVHKIVPMECDYDAAGLFKEGKAAMLINGDWSLAGYQADEVKSKVDLGVARIPMVSKTGRWLPDDLRHILHAP